MDPNKPSKLQNKPSKLENKPSNLEKKPSNLENKPSKLQYIIIGFLAISVISVIGFLVYIFFLKNNSNDNNSNYNDNDNNNSDSDSDSYINSIRNGPKTDIPSQMVEISDDTPKTITNGKYYDYSKVNIKPTITILPAKIYDTITEIKGSVTSDVLASNDYNSKYVVYSGSDKATIITPDMIPKFNTKELPKQSIEFIWTDVNSGKCYVPENISKDLDKIVLADCFGNNANYIWEDGFIKHVNSNRYLQTWNNKDMPEENESLSLSKMENYQRTVSRQFDFIQSGDNLTNAKIIHRPSESGKCIVPNVGTNGKVLLSLSSVSC
jgi:hypothetical protein